jgi:hypothetical protein
VFVRHDCGTLADGSRTGVTSANAERLTSGSSTLDCRPVVGIVMWRDTYVAA